MLFQLDTSVLIYDEQVLPELEVTNLNDLFDMAEIRTGITLQRNFQQLHGLFEREKPALVDLYWDKLYQLVADKHIELSAFSTDYYTDGFIFGYLDGGEAHNPSDLKLPAFDAQGNPKKIGLTVNPKYSVVSVNLLALKSHKQAAQCVARTMAGRKFLDWVTQTSYYFSPYGDIPVNELKQPISQVARDFQNNLGELNWLIMKPRPEGYYSDHARNTWNKIIVCLRNRDQDCRALVAGY